MKVCLSRSDVSDEIPVLLFITSRETNGLEGKETGGGGDGWRSSGQGGACAEILRKGMSETGGQKRAGMRVYMSLCSCTACLCASMCSCVHEYKCVRVCSHAHCQYAHCAGICA